MRRTITLSMTLAAVAVLGAGCQNSLRSPQHNDAAAARPATDNTQAMCDAFRNFELDHRDAPGPESFNTVAATAMTKLADRATDPAVATDLRAVATQISTLAARPDLTYDQAEKANPGIFTAGGQAWMSLESRCGKAVIPTP
jgi:hypothetical protein